MCFTHFLCVIKAVHLVLHPRKGEFYVLISKRSDL